MTDDISMTSDELTKEEKIQKLEQLCEQVGLDVEELAGGPIETLDLSGVITVHLEDDEGNVKHHEEIEF